MEQSEQYLYINYYKYIKKNQIIYTIIKKVSLVVSTSNNKNINYPK